MTDRLLDVLWPGRREVPVAVQVPLLAWATVAALAWPSLALWGRLQLAPLSGAPQRLVLWAGDFSLTLALLLLVPWFYGMWTFALASVGSLLVPTLRVHARFFLIAALCAAGGLLQAFVDDDAYAQRAYERVARNGAPLVAAIDRFEAQHGTYPATLRDLVPDYLGRLPEPGVACAEPFAYDRFNVADTGDTFPGIAPPPRGPDGYRVTAELRGRALFYAALVFERRHPGHEPEGPYDGWRLIVD